MDYIGTELELFQNAKNWKTYWSSHIERFVSGDVLEVGAGLGGNIPYLSSSVDSYTALEPDNSLAEKIGENAKNEPSVDLKVISGTLIEIESGSLFDTIIYIDVLEHIEDDADEFQRAISHLKKGGHLIVLCPAHQFLFSEFDRAVGHYRRYSKRSFRNLSSADECGSVVQIRYLDSVGLFASLANRFLLKSGTPTKSQISFWDRVMVPLSRVFDILTFQTLGKTVIGVWQRN